MARVEDDVGTIRGGLMSRRAIGIAAGLRLSNQSTDALALLEQAEPIAAQHDLTLDLARLHHLRGNLYFPLGKVVACGEAHGKAL